MMTWSALRTNRARASALLSPSPGGVEARAMVALEARSAVFAGGGARGSPRSRRSWRRRRALAASRRGRVRETPARFVEFCGARILRNDVDGGVHAVSVSAEFPLTEQSTATQSRGLEQSSSSPPLIRAAPCRPIAGRRRAPGGLTSPSPRLARAERAWSWPPRARGLAVNHRGARARAP